MVRFFWLSAVFAFLLQAEIIQAKPSTENLKLWLNPDDGVVATENTPVHALRKKKTSEDSPVEYEFVKYENYMKDAAAYLRAAKPKILLNTTYNSFVEEENLSLTPYVVHIEVLVIVDNLLYRKFNSDLYDAVEYILAYWTGVDLQFRDIVVPKIRINIAGILIIEDPNALPYVEYSPNKIDSFNTFMNFSYWLHERQDYLPSENYDIAFFMTGKNIEISNEIKSKEQGSTLRGHMCKHFENRVMKMAMLRDLGVFDSIHSAVKLLAESIGVRRDGRDEKCPLREGTYMDLDAPVNPPKYPKWSECSKLDFLYAFLAGEFDCVRNRPRQGVPVPRILPGKLKHLEKQNCVESLDGSSCGDGKICLFGDCIEEKLI